MKTSNSKSKLSSASEYALIVGAGASAAVSLAAQQAAAASLPITALVALGLVNRHRLDQQVKEGMPLDSRLEEQSLSENDSLQQRITTSPLPERLVAQAQVVPHQNYSVGFSRKQRAAFDQERLMAAQKESLKEIGVYLSQKREEQGLSLQEIHQRTYIQRYALKAIEAGDLETLPEPFYVRAFIQKYAIALGLTGPEVAEHFPVI